MLGCKSMASIYRWNWTWAAISVISEQEWNQLFTSTQLERYVGGPLRGYSGQQLEVKDQKEVQVEELVGPLSAA